MVPIHEMGDVPPTPTQSQLSIKDASHLRGFIGCAVAAGMNSVNSNATAHGISDTNNIFLILSHLHTRIALGNYDVEKYVSIFLSKGKTTMAHATMPELMV